MSGVAERVLVKEPDVGDYIWVVHTQPPIMRALDILCPLAKGDKFKFKECDFNRMFNGCFLWKFEALKTASFQKGTVVPICSCTVTEYMKPVLESGQEG